MRFSQDELVGVRLGGQELGVQVGGFAAVAWRAAELSAVGGLTLAEQKVVRSALDGLARLEPERLGAGSPPAAGWFSPGPADLDVIPGRVFGLALVGLLPDVIEVVALAQGRDNRQTGLCRRRPEATELTTIVKWCMGVTESKIMD